MISIIEFFVYGLITYGTLLFMIKSSMGEMSLDQSQSIVRCGLVFPALILSLLIAGMSPEILLFEETTIITNSTNDISYITNETISMTELQNTSWMIIHNMLFFVFLFYIILNVVNSVRNKK